MTSALVFIDSTDNGGFWVVIPKIAGLSAIWRAGPEDETPTWAFTVYIQDMVHMTKYFDNIEEAREAYNEIFTTLQSFYEKEFNT